ncbi:MAG: serine hydrolase [Elainellaceae cyanobacterium]
MADSRRPRRSRQQATRQQTPQRQASQRPTPRRHRPTSPSRPPSRLDQKRSSRRQILNLPPGQRPQSAGQPRSSQSLAPLSQSRLRLLSAAEPNPTDSNRPSPRQPPQPALPSRPAARRPKISDYASAFGGRRQGQRLGRRSPQQSALRRSPGGAVAIRRSPQLTPVPIPTPSRPAVAALTPVASPPRSRPRPRKRLSRKASRWLYGVRLLILAVGVGAIAGTLLSVLNPVRVRVEPAALQDAVEPSAPETAAQAQVTSDLAAGGFEMTGLKTAIAEAIADYPQLTAKAAILDLDTGGYIDIAGQASTSAASIIKVPILVAFLQAVEAGDIALTDTVTIQEADVAEGSGTMQYEPVGTTYTALETADMMITISDNTATNILIRRLGGIAAVNQRFAQWGLAQTTIAQPLPDLEGQNKTTPTEMVTLLTTVSNGNLLAPRSRDLMFDIMRHTVTDTLLPQGIAPNATIAHKTGDIGEMIGDIGVIDTPIGKRYAIAVMVERPYNDDQAADLVRYISELAYDAVSDIDMSNDDSEPEANQLEAPLE